MKFYTVEFSKEPYQLTWLGMSLLVLREDLGRTWEEMKEKYQSDAEEMVRSGLRMHFYNQDEEGHLVLLDRFLWLNLQKRPRFINKDN